MRHRETMPGKVYNPFVEKIILPVGDFVDGGNFMSWLSKYRLEQWYPAEKLRQLQSERLSNILQFARQNIPFYKNLPIQRLDPFEDIKQFPILNKEIINDSLEQLLTKPKDKLIAESGSGSSGIQGTVYMDKSAQASQRAMQALWFEWCGYKFGDSILQTGMTLNRGIIKGLKDFFLDTDYIPAFNLDSDTIAEILYKLEKNPRKYLFGYASSLYLIAQTALELNIDSVRFNYAVSWGDKLFPHYRKKIQQAFSCQTLDTYGCTEGAMIGAECPNGKFHLSTNQCYLEVIDDYGFPVADGEMGKVVVTRLDNFAMPLIRYYLGDIVELDVKENSICNCKRQTPTIRRIVGRDTDIVRTRSGKQLIVHFFTAIFEHIPQIRQFKVVQENLDSIEIHYIPCSDFELPILNKIEGQIHNNLKEKFSIRWVAQEKILPTKSGKPQIIQSFLKQSLTH